MRTGRWQWLYELHFPGEIFAIASTTWRGFPFVFCLLSALQLHWSLSSFRHHNVSTHMAWTMRSVWSMASQTTPLCLWSFGVHPKTAISGDVHSKSTTTSAGRPGPTSGATLVSRAPWNGTKGERLSRRLRCPGIPIAVALLGGVFGWWERMDFFSATMK